MNEHDPIYDNSQRQPRPVELSAEAAARIKEQIETLQHVGRAAIEGKNSAEQAKAEETATRGSAEAAHTAVPDTATSDPQLHLVKPVIDSVPWQKS